MLKNQMNYLKLFFVSLVLFTPVFADEVTDTINTAVKNYNEGKFAEAAGNLDNAAQMVRQKRGSNLQKFLPAPLSGWKAGEPKSEAMGASMFGGMLTAEKKYNKEQSGINVKIITDSPMLQSMMMLFQNPMLATSDGGKLEKIKDQKAIVRYQTTDKTGQISIVVANRYLIQIDGDSVAEQDMMDYANSIDFDGLSKLS